MLKDFEFVHNYSK